jgi:hypothetical protein
MDEKGDLAMKPLLAALPLLLAALPAFAQELEYEPTDAPTADSCDYRDFGQSSRPSRVYELLCWQAGRLIIHESCLSAPTVHDDKPQLYIDAQQYFDPLTLVPGDATCIFRHMKEDRHTRNRTAP